MKIWIISIMVLLTVTATGISKAAPRSDYAETIPEIFRRISPSVVFITAVMIDPLDLTSRVRSSTGSGFIIKSEGLILTNSHVVFRGHAITVTLDDGSVREAKLLGADPILDLAVLRISPPPGGLPAATLGDSGAIQVGEEVIAVGNPMGLDQTLTRGVVSGMNRMLATAPMNLMLPLIQTDAAINPGSSGGPLLNRRGEVIGITTYRLAGAENIGFAVPINIAKDALSQLVNEGRIIRPWLGIDGKLIKSKELKVFFNLPLVDGFLVEAVEPGSPAEKAGIRGGGIPVSISGLEFLFGGDIITAVNGRRVKDPKEFLEFLQSLKVGDKVHLDIYRQGEQLKKELKLVERPILPSDLLWFRNQ